MKKPILGLLLAGYSMLCSAEGVTVALTSSCPSQAGAKVAPIVAILAPALLQTMFQALGDGLVNASGKNNPVYTTQGTARGYFYVLEGAPPARQINSDLGCIVAKVGSTFELEAKVLFSDDRTALAVVPIAAKYEKRIGPSSSIKSLSVTIDFLGTSGGAFASGALPLDIVPTKSKKWEEKDLSHAASGWLPILSPGESLNSLLNSLIEKYNRKSALSDLISAEKDPTAKAKLDAEQKNLAAEIPVLTAQLKHHGPVGVRVTLAETRNINEFLAALGEAISSKKTELATAAYNKLVPPQPDATSQLATVTAIGAYWAKRYQFDEAVRVYFAKKADATTLPADLATAKISAIEAQYGALAAAISAGVVLPADDALRTFAP